MHTLLSDIAVTTTSSTPSSGLVTTYFVLAFLSYLIASLALMGIFTKAGEAGWMGFIPILNTIILIKIAGKPIWWILLLLIPIVNVVILILVLHGVSVSFGHGAAFTIGLIFLSVIFYYILWLGPSTYRGPGGTGVPAPAYGTA